MATENIIIDLSAPLSSWKALFSSAGITETLRLEIQKPSPESLVFFLSLLREPVYSSLRSRIKALALSDNEIGDEGAHALAESPHLANLTTLDLASNGIGYPGARALANSPHLANLTTLALSYNQIGDAGAQALLFSKHLRALQDVDLSGNDLSIPVTQTGAVSALRREYQIRGWLMLVPLPLVRVMLLGVPRVGKTTLFDALAGKTYQFGDQLRTQGFQHQLNTSLAKSIKTLDQGELDFQCDIWDMGGDTLQHMLHTLFMRPNSLYLLLLDQSSCDRPQPIYDWMDQIANQMEGACELIPVMNPRRPIQKPIDLDSVRSMFDTYRADSMSLSGNSTALGRGKRFSIRPPLVVNLHPDQQDLEEIKFELRRCLQTHPVREYLQFHDQLKNIVFKWDKNYLHYNEFVSRLMDDEDAQAAFEAYNEQVLEKALVHEAEIDSEGQQDFFERAVDYLDHIGVVFYLRELRCVVLNPDWVSHGLYALLPPPEDKGRGDDTIQRFRDKMLQPHPEVGLPGVFSSEEAYTVLKAMARAKFQGTPLQTDTEQLFKIICHPMLNLVIDLAQVGRPGYFFMPVYLEDQDSGFEEPPSALTINLLITAFNSCPSVFSPVYDN